MKKIYYTTLKNGKEIYVTPGQMEKIKDRENRLKKAKEKLCY